MGVGKFYTLTRPQSTPIIENIPTFRAISRFLDGRALHQGKLYTSRPPSRDSMPLLRENINLSLFNVLFANSAQALQNVKLPLTETLQLRFSDLAARLVTV
jgi:hypothetical protein